MVTARGEPGLGHIRLGQIQPANGGVRASGWAGPRRRRQVARGTAGTLAGWAEAQRSAAVCRLSPARHASTAPHRAWVSAAAAAAASRSGRSSEADALPAVPGTGGQVQPGGPGLRGGSSRDPDRDPGAVGPGQGRGDCKAMDARSWLCESVSRGTAKFGSWWGVPPWGGGVPDAE